MRLAVVLSGFACYHQVAPTGLDENGRAPEECEMRAEPGAPLSFFQDCHHWVNGARTFLSAPRAQSTSRRTGMSALQTDARLALILFFCNKSIYKIALM